MKRNFFVKRTIKYFSFYLLTILLVNNLFFTINSKKLVEAHSRDTKEIIQKVLYGINDKVYNELNEALEGARVKGSRFIDYILETEKDSEESLLVNKEKMEKIAKLVDEPFIKNEVNVWKAEDYKEKIYKNKIHVVNRRETYIAGEKYVVEVVSFIDKGYFLNKRYSFVNNINIINDQSEKNNEIFEIFKADRGKKMLVSTQGDPYEVFRVYVPIREGEKVASIYHYDFSLNLYKKTVEKIEKKNVDFFKGMIKNMYVATIFFYLIALVFLRYVVFNLYEPMQEIFVTIDEIAKGKFGRKIKLSGRKTGRDLVRKINKLSSNLNFIRKVKQEFLLKKSQEFKEIVEGIVGLTESSLVNKEISFLERDRFELINENATHLLTSLNSLNEYYHLDDEDEPVEESIHIKALVEELAIDLNTKLSNKKLELVNEVEEDSHVTGDSIKLYVIFSHLIENAIRYSSEEGKIYVKGKKKGENLNISIIDKGEGIHKEKLLALKEFLEEGIDNKYSGLGLGLSKRIIELHEGKMSISSKVGKGTEIKFNLKINEGYIGNMKEDKLKVLIKNTNVDSNHPVFGNKHRIIILCDRLLNAKLILNYLNRSRYSIYLTDNKAELLKKISEEEYDLIIVDYFGVWIRDYELIKKVRGIKNKGELPLILLNNRNKGEDLQTAFHAGATEVLNKPLFRDEFLIKIETQLKIKKTLVSMEKVNRNYIKERQERILAENLRDFHTELTSTLNVKKIFLILFRKIKYLFDYESALVLLKTEGKYQTIFQEGPLEKEEKTDTLFKSRYLDPIVDSGRIIVINKYKCRKYFSDKIKSAIAIPLRYKKNERCVIIIKSEEEQFFRKLSKSTIDSLFYQSSIAIKNANLYGELEKKNIKLNMLIEKIKIIDKLISVIYNEKDKKSAIYYLLLVLVGNKMKLSYKEAYFFEYDKNEEGLRCSNYYFNINKYSDEYENNLKEKELWAKNLFISLENKNLLTEAFENGENYYSREVVEEDVIIHEKLTKVTVLPIKYENNKFGVIVLESDNKRKTVDDNEKESLSIFAANLGIYLQTKLLEEESVKYHKSRTLNTFAKSIVHELRTPLVGIKGFAAMTKEKYHGDQKLSFYMDNIISDAERVIDLSSQIVDFVEEENAKYAFKSESFTRGIMEVINEFKRDLELNSIELNCFKEDFFIPYDKVKMKKVFRHIIKNSIENIDFNKKEHKISIEKTIERDMIIISFIDNGVGIDQEMLKEAFNPLVSSKIQGTGLGLPLSKNIVEKHGFDLTIDSIEGEYTKVNIIIS